MKQRSRLIGLAVVLSFAIAVWDAWGRDGASAPPTERPVCEAHPTGFCPLK